ncbi:ImmA/IrrE family metallo-endopeptidase [Actinomadura atramentaria]|uniref:ImmA/IrrE family metallo-endopeptidase n=1 Tax=Actinomadura atramentaria TaxID=1990 RepID=UPI00035FF181|nr:ImmA/IrrE family metallo-endopeptidase [Actinomadura atramentaria]
MNERFSDSGAARLRFDGDRLTLARRLRGLRKNQLAQAVGTTPAAIGRYEAGIARPPDPASARLAVALGVPVEFFRGGRASRAPDAAHFRSLRATSQLERDQALAYGRLAADLVAVLEEAVEFPPPTLPERPVAPDEIAGPGPADAARLARAALHPQPGPIGHVVRLLEGSGVIVLVLPRATERVDAFSVGAHPRPLVLFNPAKGDYWRNRFDAAHELGHLVMHADAEPGEKIVEDQAQRFAAEFLMPAAEIAAELPAVADWDRLAALKARWGVSLAALLYRARTLGVMREPIYRSAMAALARQNSRNHPAPPDAVPSDARLGGHAHVRRGDRTADEPGGRIGRRAAEPPPGEAASPRDRAADLRDEPGGRIGRWTAEPPRSEPATRGDRATDRHHDEPGERIGRWTAEPPHSEPASRGDRTADEPGGRIGRWTAEPPRSEPASGGRPGTGRRREPGPARPLERPTMLTRAIEVAAEAGLSRAELAARAGIPRADLDQLVPPR